MHSINFLLTYLLTEPQPRSKAEPVASVKTAQTTLDGDSSVVEQSVVRGEHGTAGSDVQRRQTAEPRRGRRQCFLDDLGHAISRHPHNAGHCL